MFVKTVTYEDYNGKTRTEDFYFNLSEAEIAEMDVVEENGLVEKLQKIINEQDGKKIMTAFKDLVLRSYGIKSEDGKRFIKNDKIREEFSQTQAYVQIFMELAFDADASAEFVNGIIPKKKNPPSDRTNVAPPLV